MANLLLVVDFQKDFIDGALGFPGAEALTGPIVERIQEYRRRGDDVAFTVDTHGPDYLQTQEGRNLPVPHCIRESEGWYLQDQVAQQVLDSDELFCKPAFPSLELAQWLEESEYEQVELCGLVSHLCVLANAVMVRAALPEARLVLDARLTASPDPVLHEKALDLLEAMFVTVTHREGRQP